MRLTTLNFGGSPTMPFYFHIFWDSGLIKKSLVKVLVFNWAIDIDLFQLSGFSEFLINLEDIGFVMASSWDTINIFINSCNFCFTFGFISCWLYNSVLFLIIVFVFLSSHLFCNLNSSYTSLALAKRIAFDRTALVFFTDG